MRAELVGASRATLLRVLRASPGALSSHDLAEAAGLHVTTVRSHLEILSRSGLVEAEARRHGRGRPRLLYRLVSGTSDEHGDEDPPEPVPAPVPPPAPGGPDQGSHVLAMLLAAYWDEDPAARVYRARQAGRASAIDSPAVPTQAQAGRDSAAGMTVAGAAELIGAGFAERGFSPEVGPEGDGIVIRLRSCPFRSVARAHPDVVCGLHLGMLQGTWERLGAPPVRATLHPFAEPGACLARLTAQPHESASEMGLVPSSPTQG